MDLVSLAIFAVALVGLGSAATVLLTSWVPLHVAELASKHGRYVGLEAATGHEAMPNDARVGAVMGAIGSSN
ncbi:hypothetical protein DIE23_08580 [Burkholderia sp. Bp9143]|uniref:hypothetical protein n=1 Tax=Burkholderia sp. Bp9143 TaxID=2184574 RepID=UPI000F59EF77|nr:hypothetical protein [Burkholderia sp. Bp9143]RQR35637.1 hypothetical protein DIE23_08580 [Burkholderia sp. Bp9143]